MTKHDLAREVLKVAVDWWRHRLWMREHVESLDQTQVGPWEEGWRLDDRLEESIAAWIEAWRKEVSEAKPSGSNESVDS